MARTLKSFLLTKEICKYGSCTPESRNYIEGEKVANAGHIVLIGTRPGEENEHHIYSLVLKTSGLNEEPHVIEGTIRKKELTIDKFYCSCKAGVPDCKHIMGVLIHCSR